MQKINQVVKIAVLSKINFKVDQFHKNALNVSTIYLAYFYIYAQTVKITEFEQKFRESISQDKSKLISRIFSSDI